MRAELQLSDTRELTRWMEQHIERERHMMAQELHNALGQSATAIRSVALSLSLSQRLHPKDAQAEAAARLIADESSRLYDATYGIIPRLTPLVLDLSMPGMGGPEAVQRLLGQDPKARVLALSAHQDNAHRRRVLRAVAFGCLA
jgi:two-component system, NarL family, sensor histidine kinase UhpB